MFGDVIATVLRKMLVIYPTLLITTVRVDQGQGKERPLPGAGCTRACGLENGAFNDEFRRR